MTNRFSRLFPNNVKPVIGMLHVPPLPGSPRWAGDAGTVRGRVLADAAALAAGASTR
ncbi:MAG TPA: hypothetical protein VK324_02520 [Tepidisphaeraceae bacterium]|nr:hypothetical protein [Tepidisphaeraceae bacterium]